MSPPEFRPTPKYSLIHKSHGGEIYEIEKVVQGIETSKGTKGVKDPDANLMDYSTNLNPYIDSDMLQQFLSKSLMNLAKYPDSNSTNLKMALKQHLDPNLLPANLLIGAGAMDIITTFCDCFIAPHDKAIILEPTFTEYAWAVEKNGGQVIHLLRKNDELFSLDLPAIKNAIKEEGVKAIFICNPNNPNGALDPKAQLEQLITYALDQGVYVFLDEAFIEFTKLGDTIQFDLNQFPNILICRTFTKYYNIPGLRIGYCLASKLMIDALASFHPLWAVNSIAQSLVFQLLTASSRQKEIKVKIQSERESFIKRLQEIPFLHVYPSETNYILLNSRGLSISAARIQTALLKENILIRDCGNFWGLDEFYFRICIKDHKSNGEFLACFIPIIKNFAKTREATFCMDEKYIQLINRVVHKKALRGPDLKCPYYKCHAEIEDCTFCYCPFYPCKNETFGKFIESNYTGKQVWDCSNCIFIHSKFVAEKVLNAISQENCNFSQISEKRIVEIYHSVFCSYSQIGMK